MGGHAAGSPPTDGLISPSGSLAAGWRLLPGRFQIGSFHGRALFMQVYLLGVRVE